jgi:hypothetical protein
VKVCCQSLRFECNLYRYDAALQEILETLDVKDRLGASLMLLKKVGLALFTTLFCSQTTNR